MWDIIKVIIEIFLAFILGIVIAAFALFTWFMIFIWPIIIPIIVILSVVGTALGYVIARHK